jgi:ribulose-phosphate 3-epimerase
MAQIYPSLLAAPENTIDKTIKLLEPLCPGFHIDIIDNQFAPNTGISMQKANSIAKLTYRQLWVHLMVEDVESYIKQLQLPPDSIVSFHIETKTDTRGLINKILEKKWLPSIAIKPKTSVNDIFPFLETIHQVLIMSVEPGFSGQPFLASSLAKVDPLVGYRNTSHLNFKIAMDGGIGVENIREISQKGVDQVAVGSAILEAKVGPVKAYQLLSEME